MPEEFSAAEVARAGGLPLAEVRPGLWSHDDVVELQRRLLGRELGRPDDGSVDPAQLLGALEAARDRLDRQIAAVRGTLDGTARTPAEVLDGFGGSVVHDREFMEALDDLALAWARLWTAGEAVDSPAARAVAAEHRGLVGPGVDEALGAVLDRHALGVAAYARDALAV
ncbi:TipAS antibiotic-recognition domain-containing protein [Actinomycetospora sp. OC33-EN08]|uniref:TipAS antibiotic-recognition domain-containing protein n=1 Tax=Actinomycetospora aurantiaca TaxID=3129233 RepID=A0ABU8MV48_9PSEU